MDCSSHCGPGFGRAYAADRAPASAAADKHRCGARKALAIEAKLFPVSRIASSPLTVLKVSPILRAAA
jgi:hypothetical protein